MPRISSDARYQRVKIGKTLLALLATAEPPAAECKYFDTEMPSLFIRHLRSGRAVFAVKTKGNNAKTLGAIGTFKDADAARDFARIVLDRSRNDKSTDVERDGTEKPPAEQYPLTVLDVFGLRAPTKQGLIRRRKTADHVDDVPGLYRAAKRGARKYMRNTAAETALDVFVEVVGPSTKLGDVTSGHVDRFLEAVAAAPSRPGYDGRTQQTLKKYLSCVSSAFGWAVAKKHAPANPCRGVVVVVDRDQKEDKSKKARFLKPAEEDALRAALRRRDARLRRHWYDEKTGERIKRGRRGPKLRPDCKYIDHVEPIVLLALNLGARLGAILSLRWVHIEQLPVDQVCFEGSTQKAGQTYTVPLNTEALDVLAAWKPAGAKPNDLIFPAPRTGRKMKHIWTQWREVLEDAGISDYRFHDNRHTFASKLVQRRHDLYWVSKLLGHADARMSARYAKLVVDDAMVAMVESLNVPLPKRQPRAAAVLDFAPPTAELIG